MLFRQFPSLLCAAGQGHEAVVRLLLDNDADPNTKTAIDEDGDGCAALPTASPRRLQPEVTSGPEKCAALLAG